MANKPVPLKMKPAVRQEMDDLRRKVRSAPSYRIAWEKLFSGAEQNQLGGNVNVAWRRNPNLVGLWAKWRRLSQDRAVIDLAHTLEFLTEAGYRRLLREIGEGTQSPTGPLQPVWDAACRELRCGDETIRTVRGGSVATRISRILDAFEKEGWPSQIKHSLDNSISQNPVNETVRSLNEGLTKIRFHANGDHIFWSLR